jgi:hypothetical protein
MRQFRLGVPDVHDVARLGRHDAMVCGTARLGFLGYRAIDNDFGLITLSAGLCLDRSTAI